jgi:hypothetical protein
VRFGSLRLEDEDGQSLVMAVGFLLGIVLVLALVVNVGFWYASQRRAQSVADAVALAVASQAPLSGQCNDPTTLAGCYANLNWNQFTTDGTVTVDPPVGSSITVHVSHPVPGFFTSLIGEAFGTVTVGAHATATVQAPATLDNSNLQAIAQTPTYVAPIVVRDNACGTPPWTGTPGCLGAPQGLNLIEDDPTTIGDESAASFINIVDLSCALTTSGCEDPGATTLANWITCGPCLAGELGINTYVPEVSNSVLDSCPHTGPGGSGPQICTIRRALNAAKNKTLLAAVADSYASGEYHVVGYAALTITAVPSNNAWRTQTTKRITVKFQSFTPKPTLDGSGTAPAYGLQTIGLTG